MKQSSDDARHIELQIGNDIGNRYGVNQIRFAGQAFLPGVDLGGKIVGFADEIDIRGGVIRLNFLN